MPNFVTFTPNPALDVSTSVDRLVDAHKMRCATPLMHPGGGGINVARVLHRMGADVLAVYPAGGVNGERLHGLLQDEGVPDLRVQIAQETRESFTVHARDSRQEYRFVLPGPHLSPQEWRSCLASLRPLSGAWIVSSGSLPEGLGVDGHAQVARLAREIGARMVVDTSGPALQAALEEGVWLVKPSLRELSELSGLALTSREMQRHAAQQLIAKGQARMVALSLGSEGAMLVTADECLQAQALSVPVAGSVGAGDSFLGGLLWALDTGATLADALRTAMAAGSAAVMVPGTTLCDPAQVRRLQAQVMLQPC